MKSRLAHAAPSEQQAVNCLFPSTKQVSTDADFTPALVRAALAGDRRASERLTSLASKVIETRVTRSLARLEAAHGVHVEASDLVQDILVRLFERDGRVLRQWNPARGLSLKSWIWLIARRHVSRHLRTAPPIVLLDLDQLVPGSEEVCRDEALSLVEARDELSCLFASLERTLSRKALLVFTSLCIEDEGPRAIARRVGVTEQAVYAMRTRCRRVARELSSRSASASTRGAAAPGPSRTTA